MSPSDFARTAVEGAAKGLYPENWEIDLPIEDFDAAFVKGILDDVIDQIRNRDLVLKGVRLSGDVTQKLAGIVDVNSVYRSVPVATNTNLSGQMTFVFVRK